MVLSYGLSIFHTKEFPIRNILLATINAKYIHPSLGLRCLLANLGPLRDQAGILELNLRQSTSQQVALIYELRPSILCLGVYIWNHLATKALIQAYRLVEPGVKIVLGGPEVSYLPPEHPLILLSDVVVKGEGEVVLGALLQELIDGRPRDKFFLAGGQPPLEGLESPYRYYSDNDLKNKLTYVEASRGCPFSCEFCLSSLDAKVRCFPLEPFLEEMDGLIRRGGHQFKFIDRTFNLHLDRAEKIMEFWLERIKPGLYVHFELVPDRLPPELRRLIRRFPPGSLRLEVGIQTYDLETAERISRRQDYALSADNLRFLGQETAAIVHADLIVGLPGETWGSFASGFDQLWAQRPGEIQVGILKKLPGAPIARHDGPFAMVYDRLPPYEIQENSTLTSEQVSRLKHFAKYWELVVNRGKLGSLVDQILPPGFSAFSRFDSLSRYLYDKLERTWGIPLDDLRRHIEGFLTQEKRSIDDEN